MKTLTVKEAIEQGFTMYGYAKTEEQKAQKLTIDVFKEEPEHKQKLLVLFDKHNSCPSTTTEEISEILSERIGLNDEEECYRDNDDVYVTVSEIDFTEIVKTINKALEKHSYWMITDIKLVK